MATPTVIQGDVHIVGNLTGATVTPSSSTVTDASVSASAAISASKIVHQHVRTFGQSGNAADETRTIHKAYGAGTVTAVVASCITAAVGSDTCTVNIKKNGTTILSSVVTINSSSVAYTGQAGTVSVPSYSAGDEFTVTFDYTSAGGTAPTGVSATLIVRENPNP